MLRTDKILVVDLEATCWGNDPVPDGSRIDIIEIGICNMHVQTGEITDRKSFYIIPKRSEITAFCTELTGITPELIAEKGMPLERAVKYLAREYAPKGRIWASFGEFDRLQLKEQCADFGIAYPMSETHINIKSLFAVKHKLKKAKGLLRSLEFIGETPEGTHHCGADDAVNAAKVLRNVLQ